ncbi:undecaprenyl/decaprenyl-phosphate alpha-N-acetylglucosaminyl 1-phosphate transferase [Prochlorococcus sp. AH-716-E13]|nr:undecaprenyl/decaprenyl-phosphate alpha-N-acetylglucosaminyl 1-phosphate transferase [Prochlorococcus sp. AH-716-E13]
MNNQIFFGLLNLTIALFVTTYLIPKIILFGRKYNLIDKSDKRKKNRENMVRVGGISIFIGFFISQIITFGFLNIIHIEDIFLNKNTFLALAGMLFFFLIGLFEDFFTLSPFLRLALQALVMSVIWYQGFGIQILDISFLNLKSTELMLSPILNFLITFLWLVGVTNAINWVDGLDGLLGGTALINFLGIASISFYQGNFTLFYISLSLVGCCAGFLVYNFYPSRIFMGDSGSYFLGFSLASLSILTFTSFNAETLLGDFSIHKSLCLLAIPILDMIFVIFLRIKEARSPFLPDRSHLHFRILDTGISVSSTVSIIYGLAVIFTIIAYLLK